MMDTSLFIVAQLELVMINVPYIRYIQWREQEIVQYRFVSKLFRLVGTFTTFPSQGT